MTFRAAPVAGLLVLCCWLSAALVAVACSSGDSSKSSTADSIDAEETATVETSTTSVVEAATTSTTTVETTTTTLPPDPVLTILITNDDGVTAPGIATLVATLLNETQHDLVIVAPETNQSGTSDSTSSEVVSFFETQTAFGHPAVAVQGFPADSVLVALDELGVDPDLVISGINEGQNLGPAIEISGTVGAARTAARRGLPALAVSQGFADRPHYESAAELVLSWIAFHEIELSEDREDNSVVSLNVPSCEVGTPRGVVQAEVADDYAGRDIRDVDCESTEVDPGDDIDAFLAGFATLSEIAF